ncbi:hypothetical protein ABZ281_07920 [Streptomyces sp. NPDC006265]|uniref:hypothetical protein n=1 Tax=Streptomyces sp. NPDC006265 TaxID=3156740 RepID=UPI0033AD709D
MTGTSTRAERQSATEAAVDQGLAGGGADAAHPPYEMRPLLTEQDREAVADLVEQRTKWLNDRWLTPPYPGDPADLFRDPGVDSVALFEDGLPVGCLQLNRQPVLPYWDAEIYEPSLLVSLAYTAPERKTDLVGRLMTLWAMDFADRLGMAWVRCEVPSGAPSRGGTMRMHLLDHLMNVCGWQFVRPTKEKGGRPLALLQLPAQAQHLQPLICCNVPLQPAVPNLCKE